ncbi:hypothetical protein ACWCZ5_22795 [Streptomyces sp. NPDC001667]
MGRKDDQREPDDDDREYDVNQDRDRQSDYVNDPSTTDGDAPHRR